MDEKGAEVEAEAEIVVLTGSNGYTSAPIPRHFKLDKPYWVIMKQVDSKNPFFIIGVTNTELMEKEK
jgi:hypothetical protein